MSLLVKSRRFFPAVILLLCFCNSRLIAQTADQYIFNPSQGSYSYLSGSTPVTLAPISSNIPIGFTFGFCGTGYTTVKASEEGFLIFSGLQPNIYPLWCPNTSSSGLMDGSIGASSYLTTGTAPNRVFTMEWRNWRWMSGDSANISFQVKLYETSNLIQFLYKEEKGGWGGYSNFTGSIGISDINNTSFLSLNRAVPVPIASSTGFTNFVGCRPSTGQVYSFTPPVPCNAQPNAGSIGTLTFGNICAGNIVDLVDTGYSAVSGLSFQWQSSLNSGGTWTDIPGANQSYYQDMVIANIDYRLKLTCTNTNQTVYTPSASLIVNAFIAYNPLPYTQDFEHWFSYCNGLDVPGPGWLNTSASGSSNLWRRDDQAYLGNGYSSLPGVFITDYASGNHSAVFPGGAATIGVPGPNLDMYVDCSAQSGDKGLYFYHLDKEKLQNSNNQLSIGLDSLIVLMSTNGGGSFTRLAGYSNDTILWEKKYISLPSNSPNTVIRFQVKREGGVVVRNIEIDSVHVAESCTGMPVAGVISPAGPLSGCPGAGFTLHAVGATMAGNLTYTWEYSDNAGSSWNVVPSANDMTLRIPGLYQTTLLRFRVTCNSTGQTAVSSTVNINIQLPSGGYASIPFTESFENWVDQCDTNDVPGTVGNVVWATAPAVGPRCIRREDHWAFPGFNPIAVDGVHCARFKAGGQQDFGGLTTAQIDSVANITGKLDLLADCSSPGSKQLQFYLNFSNVTSPLSTTEPVKIYLSTNGGLTFSKIAAYFTTSQWEFKTLFIPSNSPKTIIRFAFETGDHTVNIGLDNVKLLGDCSGQPSAGMVDSVRRICANRPFPLGLTGATAAQLTYRWQRSANGNNWNNIPGATTETYQYAISANTWFRCIVTCDVSGLSDTTAPRYFELAPFYFCYCQASPWAEGTSINIGYAEVRDSITNTVAVVTGNPNLNLSTNTLEFHTYSDFMDLPVTIYRDTTYLMGLSLLHSFPSNPSLTPSLACGFIDFNRDGQYDTSTEKVFQRELSSDNLVDSQFFTVPVNAGVGYTGMRLMIKNEYFSLNGSVPPDPCDYDSYLGEVEDYVVKIDFAPCNGPANAGIAIIDDTLVLSGTTVQLTNTTHANPDSLELSQIAWIWQSSLDGIIWSDIPGSEMQDTLEQSLTVKTWYRLKMICQHSGDNSYSNVVYANISNTGISSVVGFETLQIFPNPTTGKLTLKYLGNSKQSLIVTVADITGKQLKRKEFKIIDKSFTTDLDLTGFAKGVYLIQTSIDSQQFNNRIILK